MNRTNTKGKQGGGGAAPLPLRPRWDDPFLLGGGREGRRRGMSGVRRGRTTFAAKNK